jgi:heme/copper-type cytochrome/quinol oxidase subunit 1
MPNCKARSPGASARRNPWEAPHLEWATLSPPPHYNFARTPRVFSRMPLWDAEPER